MLNKVGSYVGTDDPNGAFPEPSTTAPYSLAEVVADVESKATCPSMVNLIRIVLAVALIVISDKNSIDPEPDTLNKVFRTPDVIAPLKTVFEFAIPIVALTWYGVHPVVEKAFVITLGGR